MWLNLEHLQTFIGLRNINLKNPLSYNSAIVSRSMGFALEIQHLFSFKQRGLIITDSLSCLILGSFYWHGCNIRSGTYKERGGGGGGNVATGLQLEKRHPEALLAQAICQTSHHTSHKPQQKTKLMCKRWSGSIPSYLSPPVVSRSQTAFFILGRGKKGLVHHP